jgi:hypothetical protein
MLLLRAKDSPPTLIAKFYAAFLWHLLLLLWEIMSWDMGHWGRLAGSNFYCAGTDPADSCPEAETWEGSYLMYPCKQVTEAKSKAQPTCGCMWLHWLFHFPSAMWPSCFNSLRFISLLCHPLPLTHQNTACLFLFWSSSLPLHSPLWCSDPPRVKDHHLDLEVCIFIASLHVWLFCQQIESSCSFISYNFNNILQPDDMVEHI